jgi:TonB family protein
MKTQTEERAINESNNTDYGFKEMKVFIGRNTFKGLLSASVLTALVVLVNCGFQSSSALTAEKDNSINVALPVNLSNINYTYDIIAPPTSNTSVTVSDIAKILGTQFVGGDPKPIDEPISGSDNVFASPEDMASSLNHTGNFDPAGASDNDVEKLLKVISLPPAEGMPPSPEVKTGFQDFEVETPPKFDYEQLVSILVYPKIAIDAKIEGKVLVNVLISAEGKPVIFNIIVTPSGLLAESAISALKKITYSPALTGGNSVNCWISVPINFRLRNKN